MTETSLVGQVSRDSLNKRGLTICFGARRVDNRIHDERERQSNPETEDDLDAASRTGRELRTVILVAEVVPMLLARRPREFLGHTARTLPHGSDIVKHRST